MELQNRVWFLADPRDGNVGAWSEAWSIWKFDSCCSSSTSDTLHLSHSSMLNASFQSISNVRLFHLTPGLGASSQLKSRKRAKVLSRALLLPKCPPWFVTCLPGKHQTAAAGLPAAFLSSKPLPCPLLCQACPLSCPAWHWLSIAMAGAGVTHEGNTPGHTDHNWSEPKTLSLVGRLATALCPGFLILAQFRVQTTAKNLCRKSSECPASLSKIHNFLAWPRSSEALHSTFDYWQRWGCIGCCCLNVF